MSFSEEYEFRCDRCGFRTQNEEGKIQHASSHRTESRFCFFKDCGKSFTVESNLRRHMKNIHKLDADFKFPTQKVVFTLVRRRGVQKSSGETYKPPDQAQKRKLQEEADAFYGKRPSLGLFNSIKIKTAPPPPPEVDEWEKLLEE